MTVSSREQVVLPPLSCWGRGGSSESGKEGMDEDFLFISRLKDLDMA